MNRKSLASLIALNVVLLVALVVTALAPQPAAAQGFNRAQYMMVSGSVTGRESQKVLYIIEVGSEQMIALFYNSANDTFEPLGKRKIGDDFRAPAGRDEKEKDKRNR